MLICKIGDYLKKKIDNASPSPVPGSPYNRISEDIIGMASAYHDDGFSFHRTGDRVNAFASFAYGLGWLDAGIFTGLVGVHENDMNPPDFLTGFDEKITEMLTEKTTRYERMLSKAMTSVSMYPDRSSPAFNAASKIFRNTKNNLEKGFHYLKKNDFWEALWHFSYGYGWLDAGIRAGLIEVTGNRHLFTID